MKFRDVGFIVLQLGGGLAGFVLWGALGSTDTKAFVELSGVLAWGMVLYLPLTLGIPFILPNFFRSSMRGEDEAWVLGNRFLRLNLSVLLVGAATMSLGGMTLASVAGFAVMVSASVFVQQLARVRDSLLQMAVASSYNVALPVVGLIGQSHLGGHLYAPIVLAWAAVVLTTAYVVRPKGRRSAVVGSASQMSLTLVPHMLAFAVLGQGVRLPASLTGDDSIAVEAHVLMLVLGVGLAGLSSVNSLITVKTQMVGGDGLASALRRNSIRLGIIACLASMGLIGLFLSPWAAALGAGDLARSLPTLVALSLVLPLYAVYFLGVSVLLRSRSASYLWRITVPLAAGWLGLAFCLHFLGFGVAATMWGYVVALAVMTGVTTAVAGRVESSFEIRRIVAGSATAFVPALVVGIVGAGVALAS